ncbi:thiolase family protein [Micromonospora sp. NPDC047074]|uniref:thiolase family protein n=1 Tax=Micromonospora sp. NPDC047074 TaxID=3154339 RepID=UPI0033E4E8DF
MTGGTAAVLGAAQSAFGRFPARRLEDLTWDAVGAALDLAGIEPAQVEAVFVGNVFGPSGVAARVVRAAGIGDVPVVRVEAACASGTLAAHLATQAVRRGEHAVVLALGVEQMSVRFGGAIVPEHSDPEGSLGLPLPGLYALQARRYLEQYGHTVADLAAVAVKNRAQGAKNPLAHRQQEVSLREVLDSRPIAEPLTVLQCCPISDGAAAAVIGRPRPGAGDVLVDGSGFVGGQAWPGTPDEPWGTACIRRAGDLAVAEAGWPASDAEVFEVHDAFTIGELLTVEALGLCEPGAAPALLHAGEFAAGGRWPVNVGGGLLARGHALGATGIAQLAEVCAQLTGRAGARQLPAPRRGLVETMGGGASGLDGNAAGVIMLRAE